MEVCQNVSRPLQQHKQSNPVKWRALQSALGREIPKSTPTSPIAVVVFDPSDLRGDTMLQSGCRTSEEDEAGKGRDGSCLSFLGRWC